MDRKTLASLLKIASTQTPDERDVEKAFGEQAYTVCTNKAGPLMGDQFRLGFESVDHNDDFTKCLGLWVYRIDKELLMVPCMFINGTIKGTDLLYRAGPKKFVPHTPDYCQYLLDLTTQDEGRAQTRADTGKLQPLFHAERLLKTPEAFGKLSSRQDNRLPAEYREQVKEASRDMWLQLKAAGVLRDFIQNSGHGYEVIDAMTDMMNKSAAFSRAIALHFPPEQWIPDQIAVKEAAKTEDPVLLQLFKGTPSAEVLAGAFNPSKVANDLYTQGYALDKPDTCPVPEHNTVVYDGGPPELRSPGTPGVVTLLLAGGDKVKALLGLEMSGWDFTSAKDDCESGMCAGSPVSSISTVSRHPSLQALVLDRPDSIEDGVIWSGRAPLWTEPQDAGQLDQQGVPVSDAAADDLYCFLHPESGRMTEPLYLVDKRKVGSVTHLSIATYPGSPGNLVILNPDAKEAKLRNVINNTWRAVRVPYRTRDDRGNVCCGSGGVGTFTDKKAPEWFCPALSPASTQDIRASVTQNLPTTKLAALKHEPQAGRDYYNITIDGQKSRLMTPEQLHVKLAATLMIDPEMALAMMQRTKEASKAEFWLEFPEKLASAMLRLVDREHFQDTMDPIFQVRQQPDQKATLRTVRTPIYTPNPRIGDKYDSVRGAQNPNDSSGSSQSVPAKILFTASPDQLAEYAQMHQIPHVFDHAIFSSMAKTYDSQMFIDQYLAKIEDGVDSLGRCIFLFYWKPQDWTKMYGQDDLSEIEDKLLNAFKSAGDILLDLLKKSRSSASSPVMS